MKKIALISASLALILFSGCTSTKNDTNKISSQPVEITGVRKSDLNAGSENLPVIEYHSPAPIPGKVKSFEKSFPDAPPMIPHSVSGMVPIKVGKNMCLNCHMPQTAKALGVTPMPKDHLNGNKVAGSRYFCTLCHTPQAKVDPVIHHKFNSLKNK